MKTITTLLLGGFLLASMPAKAVKIGIENVDNYPYFSWRDGQYSGICRDLIMKFFEEKKVNPTFEAYPLKRLYHNFLNRKLDFKFPDNPDWNKTDKKNKKIFYSKPLAYYTDGAMVLPKNRGKRITSLAIVMGYTPSSYQALVKENKLKIHQERSVRSILMRVIKGISDAAYINIEVARHVLKINQWEGKLVFDSSLPHDSGGYSLSSMQHEAVIKEFNQFLSKPDLMEEVYQRHNVSYQKNWGH